MATRAQKTAMREIAARAIMEDEGFTYSGDKTLVEEAAAGNPRVRGWVRKGDAVLKAIHPRTRW